MKHVCKRKIYHDNALARFEFISMPLALWIRQVITDEIIARAPSITLVGHKLRGVKHAALASSGHDWVLDSSRPRRCVSALIPRAAGGTVLRTHFLFVLDIYKGCKA